MALMLMEDENVNHLSFIGNGSDEEETDYLFENKMLDIGTILGLNIEGQAEEWRNLIRELLVKVNSKNSQGDIPKGQRKPKGKRELANLASSINYDQPDRERERERLEYRHHEIDLLECSRNELAS